MKKNGFLTFIFACIPGAGQMYYGYMQRGLSIAMMLMLCVMAATVIEPLLFLCLVIWMYSFFDTYDLIRHMAAGEPKEDSLLVPGNYEEIKKLLPQHNKLIGWGLVGIGVWALYDTFISNWLYTLLCNLVGNGYAYDIITGIPNVVIAALLIFAILNAGLCGCSSPVFKSNTPFLQFHKYGILSKSPIFHGFIPFANRTISNKGRAFLFALNFLR